MLKSPAWKYFASYGFYPVYWNKTQDALVYHVNIGNDCNRFENTFFISIYIYIYRNDTYRKGYFNKAK